MKSVPVLIVDDSSVMRTIVGRSLREAGMQLGEVAEAGNGMEALSVIQNLLNIDSLGPALLDCAANRGSALHKRATAESNRCFFRRIETHTAGKACRTPQTGLRAPFRRTSSPRLPDALRSWNQSSARPCSRTGTRFD